MREKQEVKKHTAIYLPQELLKQLALYQLRKTGGAYGRNKIIIQAIEEFLKRNQE